jgi:GAF domain
MQQESSTRSSQATVSAAIAAANAELRGTGSDGTGLKVHFSHEDRGRSLAEMAQRDLDAALQLLTDRAQYITGSSGAAIALRRSGTNDMLCRASTGSNAPELGTLLSTEFGLSGESVRTRRALRCDDAERDARVNHDVCREVGIASVVVMPVVHDDEVLGVFELFSGKAHAFGERDLSALRRLSEMVETAVRLARASEGMTERWKTAQPAAGVSSGKTAAGMMEAQDAPAVERADVGSSGIGTSGINGSAVRGLNPADFNLNDLNAEYPVEVETEFGPAAKAVVAMTAEMPNICIDAAAGIPPLPANTPFPIPAPLKKPVLWSAPANVNAEAAKSAEVDRSHFPAAFRNLRKCEACGFPVSSDRLLCVECEEKKWRGQLKPRASAVATSGSAAAAAPAPERKPGTGQEALPPSPRVALPAPSLTQISKAAGNIAGNDTAAKAESVKKEDKLETQTEPQTEAKGADAVQAAAHAAAVPAASAPAPARAAGVHAVAAHPAPTLVFSAGLEPSQSWLARNKYVLAALLAVAGAVAAILLLR